MNQPMGHMKRAIELAHQVIGITNPNPAVGAVLVKDGAEIGAGATQPPGQDHAEIVALKQAADLARGATLYTTLEPCCTWGRTPPCTKAIIDAGIAEVHFAVVDPNPDVSGNGRDELAAAGIRVVVEEAEGAHELYEAFAKHISTGLPFVTAKFAMSLDGKISTRTGDSKWVTGPEARGLVQKMRREGDAVLVGITTVLADDPFLTARDGDGNPLSRQPYRVVLDSSCRMPTKANMLGQPGPTLVYATTGAPKDRAERLSKAGAEVVRLEPTPDGQVDIKAVLADLGARGVVDLTVEGGGTVLGSFFDGKLVDKVLAFIAPIIVGGASAPSPVDGQGVVLMSEAWQIGSASVEKIGDDWLITGYPQAGGPP